MNEAFPSYGASQEDLALLETRPAVLISNFCKCVCVYEQIHVQ